MHAAHSDSITTCITHCWLLADLCCKVRSVPLEINEIKCMSMVGWAQPNVHGRRFFDTAMTQLGWPWCIFAGRTYKHRELGQTMMRCHMKHRWLQLCDGDRISSPWSAPTTSSSFRWLWCVVMQGLWRCRLLPWRPGPWLEMVNLRYVDKNVHRQCCGMPGYAMHPLSCLTELSYSSSQMGKWFDSMLGMCCHGDLIPIVIIKISLWTRCSSIILHAGEMTCIVVKNVLCIQYFLEAFLLHFTLLLFNINWNVLRGEIIANFHKHFHLNPFGYNNHMVCVFLGCLNKP